MSRQHPQNRDDARHGGDACGGSEMGGHEMGGHEMGGHGEALGDRWSLLIDCCRPGSNDAFDQEFPELAPLAEQIVADPSIQQRYERSQQFDGALRRALIDAPVPDDLAVRLLAKLASAPSDEDTSERESIQEATTFAPAPKSNAAANDQKRTVRWRSWLAAAAIFMLLCSLLYGALASRDRTVPVAEVIEQSKHWRSTVQAEPRAWKEIKVSRANRREAALASHPIDRRIVATPRRYRELKTTFGQAIVYDLRNAERADGDRLALLFVVKSNDSFALPSSPPIADPQSRTQGVVIGAWTRSSEKLLYVLMSEGNPNRFREFVREDRLADAATNPASRARTIHPLPAIGPSSDWPLHFDLRYGVVFAK